MKAQRKANVPEDPRRLAYHEAAHTVVALATGFPVSGARISESGEGHVFHEDNLERWFHETGDREAAMRALVTYVAGRLGEVKAGFRIEDEDGSDADDLGKAAALLLLFTEEDKRLEAFRKARQLANHLLTVGWPIVEEIAGALLQRKELTGDEALAIWRRHGTPGRAGR